VRSGATIAAENRRGEPEDIAYPRGSAPSPEEEAMARTVHRAGAGVCASCSARSSPGTSGGTRWSTVGMKPPSAISGRSVRPGGIDGGRRIWRAPVCPPRPRGAGSRPYLRRTATGSMSDGALKRPDRVDAGFEKQRDDEVAVAVGVDDHPAHAGGFEERHQPLHLRQNKGAVGVGAEQRTVFHAQVLVEEHVVGHTPAAPAPAARSRW
jgi:hypothetical protein